MFLNFNIHYLPEEGQDLYLNIVEGEKVVMSKKMGTGGDGEWKCEVRLEPRGKKSLDYYYSVQDGDKVLRTEWMMPREGKTPACPHHLPSIPFKGGTDTQASQPTGALGGIFTTYDEWMDEPIDAIMFSAPFLNCLNKRTPHKPYPQSSATQSGGSWGGLRIKVYAPQLRGNERLVLCGSHPVLGEWHPERGVPCIEQSPNEWICDINTEYTANEDLEYKFVAVEASPPCPPHEGGEKCNNFPIPQSVITPIPIKGKETGKAIIPSTVFSPLPREGQGGGASSWEIGYNRRLTVPRIKKGEMVQFCQRPAAFERPNPRMAGTIVSIHKVSDFATLPSIIDWMADTHQQWLIVDTREITRSNHAKRLQEIKDFALSRHVVMECKITSATIPLSDWWDKDLERADKYYTEVLQRRDRVPHPIPAWLAHDIMMRQLLKPDTMLCLFPYQDWKLLGDIKSIHVKDNIREMLAEANRIY